MTARRVQAAGAVAYALCDLAALARDAGEVASSRALAEESLARFRQLGDELGAAQALAQLTEGLRTSELTGPMADEAAFARPTGLTRRTDHRPRQSPRSLSLPKTSETPACLSPAARLATERGSFSPSATRGAPASTGRPIEKRSSASTTLSNCDGDQK